MWWESLSPRRSKVDTGTAVRRFRAYARRLPDTELLWYALGELAVEGLPAHYFTEKIARERVARIREVVNAEERKQWTGEVGHGNALVALRSLADQLREAGLPLGVFESVR